jgi:hypothetical protein
MKRKKHTAMIDADSKLGLYSIYYNVISFSTNIITFYVAIRKIEYSS